MCPNRPCWWYPAFRRRLLVVGGGDGLGPLIGVGMLPDVVFGAAGAGPDGVVVKSPGTVAEAEGAEHAYRLPCPMEGELPQGPEAVPA